MNEQRDKQASQRATKAAVQVAFHRTTTDRVAEIQEHGLKMGCQNNLTTNGSWSFEVYRCRPVFLSLKKTATFAEHAPIIFEVNIQGLELLTDFPSLVDAGAYYDDDDASVWFKDGPEWSYSDLLNPFSDACRGALRKTKTAACLTDIAPSRLRLIVTKKKPG